MGDPDKHRLCGCTCGSEIPINLPGTPANLPALGTAGGPRSGGTRALGESCFCEWNRGPASLVAQGPTASPGSPQPQESC